MRYEFSVNTVCTNLDKSKKGFKASAIVLGVCLSININQTEEQREMSCNFFAGDLKGAFNLLRMNEFY